MIYTAIHRCRICASSRLLPILDLGEQALTGVFPRSPLELVEKGPVELVKCDESSGGCGLVQMRHSFTPEMMYGENYGYRSGLNQSMVVHLGRRAKEAFDLAKPKKGDLILDIGSNDSTTLRSYPSEGLSFVGMDPTGVKFARYYPPHVKLIPDFFSAKRFAAEMGTRKAKIVTSIAMFYDLESPQNFMADIHEVLADDGVWVFEQSYLPTMLAANAYDTVCHEHISYYALKQIKWMADRTGLKIVRVELNDVNGGSFCVTAAKKSAPYPEATDLVSRLLAEEDRLGLSTMKPFDAFRDRVVKHRDQLSHFVAEAKRKGETIYGYGASTKGNVVLQYCGFTNQDIPMVAEVNEDKYGAYTPGTLIPIASEATVRAKKPSYLLVLPWHFKPTIVQREAAYLASGGKLLFPLPHIEVVGSQTTRCAA